MFKKLFSPLIIFVVLGLYIAETKLHLRMAHVILSSIGLALIWRLFTQIRERDRFERTTLDAYRAQNPSCYIGGKLTCCECSGERIDAVTSRDHSNFREHGCTDCGSILFYTRKDA